MSYPELKLIALALGAISYYVALTPPTPPATSNDMIYSGQLFEKLVRKISFSSKMFVTAAFMSEITMLVSTAYPISIPPPLFRAICPRLELDAENVLSTPPQFLAGLALLIVGGGIRMWCYRELGSLHTFEVAVRPEHRLVTSGPYAWVRHPSYTAVSLSILGLILLHFSRGGWNAECGIMDSGNGAWVKLYMFLALFSVASLWRRGIVEDDMLKHRFGAEWEGYRQRVPHRFMIGFY